MVPTLHQVVACEVAGQLSSLLQAMEQMLRLIIMLVTGMTVMKLHHLMVM